MWIIIFRIIGFLFVIFKKTFSKCATKMYKIDNVFRYSKI